MGRRRTENQDRLYAWWQGPIGVFLVADGMGGQRSGGTAAVIATETLTFHLQPLIAHLQDQFGLEGEPLPPVAHDDPTQPMPIIATTNGDGDPLNPSFSLMEEVGRVINLTNQAVLSYAATHPESEGLGSTLTLALVAGSLAIIANLGDSRIYLYRDGVLTQLTDDHSLVASLLKRGLITLEESYTHPQRSLIYHSLGSEWEARPDIASHPMQPGDRLIVCSDGLWEMVRDEAMIDVLHATATAQEAADQLVTMANENGGHDNIAVIVAALDS